MELTSLEHEDKPMVVDEFYGSFSTVNRDFVCEGIAAALALIPNCSTLDV